MITVRRAKHEDRVRDIKRDRLVLRVGAHRFHITRDEAASLKRQLGRFNLPDQSRRKGQ